MKIDDELWDLPQVAEFLHIKVATAYQTWPEWTEGNIVNPIRYRKKGKLLFKKSEIFNLVESWKVLRN